MLQPQPTRLTHTTAPIPNVTTATTSTVTYPAEPHHWTREMVYRDPARSYLPWPPKWAGDTGRYYTSEYVQACLSETDWIQSQPTPTLSADEQKAVGLGEIKCPLCEHGSQMPVLCRGSHTGIERHDFRPCSCRPLGYYWRQWQHTPLRFEQVGELAVLKPYPTLKLSVQRQIVIIRAMQANPEDSWLFMGRPDTGSYCPTSLTY